MNIFERLVNSIAEKLIPTAYLEKEKAEWEQQIIDGRNGEFGSFEENEEAIKDAEEELESINKRLARRQKSAK